jgi:hypothetical protein
MNRWKRPQRGKRGAYGRRAGMQRASHSLPAVMADLYFRLQEGSREDRERAEWFASSFAQGLRDLAESSPS